MTRPAARAAAPFWIGLRIMLVFTVLLGIAYPLLITGAGLLAFPGQASGSPLRAADGRIVGSSLLGQSFADGDGEPLPRYFQPRPSAAGEGYDPTASAGSNLGPENPELVARIADRRREIAAFNGVPVGTVPVDAVTASGSGLDPHIGVAYALLQIDRVAEARGMAESEVAALVERCTSGRDLGILGEPRVNVVELNLALDEAD